MPDRGVDLCLRRIAVQELQLLTVLGGLVHPLAELIHLMGLVGQGQAPGLLKVALDPVGPGELDEAPEVLQALVFQPLQLVWEMQDPVGRPCVREASQKPPFRPLAPYDTVSASSTTTCSVGSVSVRAIAVHSPVNPPPTTTTSAPVSPASGASKLGPGSRSQ